MVGDVASQTEVGDFEDVVGRHEDVARRQIAMNALQRHTHTDGHVWHIHTHRHRPSDTHTHTHTPVYKIRVRTEHSNRFSSTFQDRVFKCRRGKLAILQAATMNNRPSCYSTQHCRKVASTIHIVPQSHYLRQSLKAVTNRSNITKAKNEEKKQSIKTATVK